VANLWPPFQNPCESVGTSDPRARSPTLRSRSFDVDQPNFLNGVIHPVGDRVRSNQLHFQWPAGIVRVLEITQQIWITPDLPDELQNQFLVAAGLQHQI
jgi:hypothetical protein